MIVFNKPPVTGSEQEYVLEAIRSEKISGDGPFAQKCQNWFNKKLYPAKTLLTPSCTAALEMAAMLIDIKPGDEVIMPSYTFVSTANAFVLRGAKIIFVDIRPDTCNIDEEKIESAITNKTKAIVPVHYAGVACEMDKIMSLAEHYNLYVIEDAAQGMMSTYKGKPLGTIGHIGAYSFHETKNYTSGGEGGLLILNDDRLVLKSEIMREKGTNRSQFFRGQVDKYTWVSVGSSYLPSELQAAFLWGQLQNVSTINNFRLAIWDRYKSAFFHLQESYSLELPQIPEHCEHNAHMFYVKLKDLSERTEFIAHLKEQGIMAVFHYVPLHSSPAGLTFGDFHSKDVYTTSESERLVRLPLFFGMNNDEVEKVICGVNGFFNRT